MAILEENNFKTSGGIGAGQKLGGRYRPDIDGLRTIAVLAVLFFHLDIALFSGGYVGVDVFFVISGFLITRNIVNDIEAERFRFSNFYVRRARRLFPALFFTLALTLAVGAFILTPDHMARLGNSLIFALFSLSNFYFWSASGYFDTAAELKPLLHTWSLSVEEQYYLIWPAILVALMSRKSPRLVLCILVLTGLLSLYFTETWLSTDGAGAFYLPMFRVIEFAFGAVCVWACRYPPPTNAAAEILTALGLAMIALAVFAYDRETRFPGLAALTPCFGTALLIYAGPAKYLGRILDNRLCVGIGLTSYSLYLVHWPIIVYYKYWKLEPLSPLDQTIIVAVSIALATWMYFFIERPFRFGSKTKHYLRPAVSWGELPKPCAVAHCSCCPCLAQWRLGLALYG